MDGSKIGNPPFSPESWLLIMLEFFKRKSLKENLKEMGPALVILLATLVISTFITEFTFNFGLKAPSGFILQDCQEVVASKV